MEVLLFGVKDICDRLTQVYATLSDVRVFGITLLFTLIIMAIGSACIY